MARDSGLVLGIDIGASHIDAVIADVGNANEIVVRGVGRSITNGILKGQIISPTELVASIDRAIKRAERELGHRPQNAIVTVPPFGIQFGYSTGLVIPRNASGRVTEDDKVAAIHKAKKTIKSQDQLILHAVPVTFTSDGVPVADPVGKAGSLEVTTHFVLADAVNINTLLQVTHSLNLHVAGMVFAPIAGSQIYLSNTERRDGVLFIDIGARYTTVAFFKDELLQSAFMIPVGGEMVSSDIAQCLSVTPLEAERVKVTHGSLDLDRIGYREKVDVTSVDRGRIEIRREYLCKIILARVEELVRMIGKRADIGPEYPYDIAMTGGTSRLAGMATLASRLLGHRVRVGPPSHDSAHSVHGDYGTALGLISYGLKMGAIVPYETPPSFLERLNRKLTRWF